METVKPITPDEALDQHVSQIPSIVFEAFNKFIVENTGISRVAVFKQKDIVKYIIDNSQIKSADLYKNHWLDIEAEYEKQGWIVNYDKPAYCETYDATFTFKPATKR